MDLIIVMFLLTKHEAFSCDEIYMDYNNMVKCVRRRLKVTNFCPSPYVLFLDLRYICTKYS